MSVVSIYCAACARFSLLPRHAVDVSAAPRCACGCEARILPFASCSHEDQRLFEAIANTIEAAGITPLGAARLVDELDSARGRPAEERLSLLRQFAPRFGIIELIANPTEASSGKAVAILEALLLALSKTRSRSGIFQVATSWKRAHEE